LVLSLLVLKMLAGDLETDLPGRPDLLSHLLDVGVPSEGQGREEVGVPRRNAGIHLVLQQQELAHEPRIEPLDGREAGHGCIPSRGAGVTISMDSILDVPRDRIEEIAGVWQTRDARDRFFGKLRPEGERSGEVVPGSPSLIDRAGRIALL